MSETDHRHTGKPIAPTTVSIPTFEARTHDVIVRVEPEFLSDHSNPREDRFVWAYTVEIDNQSGADLTVASRVWTIADSRGQVQEVHGEGVVGETPLVRSGEVFRYTSGAPLTAPSAIMLGYYSMVDEDGTTFDVAVPPFPLDSPHDARVLN